ncbi:acyl-ACP desaturase [Paludisphaera borealis]|uniref:Acyl-[acyl-carrier-protein] desaturase desA1 n=1 Tax=Paludisphaera borealis TaxID=1387353 RepID=A0A1U7CME8_9BACT|nr:acyl-ACP desaturase [Paludisphaera borealis]APW60086.1 Putative acyl-[acyl-carrier-protein] desaturase desA1 [Paludisphaera borealis]
MSIVASLQDQVEENLALLAPVESAWQPTDFLPDFSAEDWYDQLKAFREGALCVPDDLLVVLVGNMITEEALPNYSISLEQIAKDPTGITDTPWARWLRGWTAEENRHGDLLNAYLRLTGRVDIRSVETTIHHLIRNGFTTGNEGNPYAGLIYASFQERATRLSHGNLARLVDRSGEETLAKICRKIAADETRHEVFYTKIVGEIFKGDPENAMLAYRHMLRRLISMPGARMEDGRDPDLFDHYSNVTQRTGVYTTTEYAGIISHLNKAWNIGSLSLTGKAAKAQDYICNQPQRYENLAPELEARSKSEPAASFSWIRDRKA